MNIAKLFNTLGPGLLYAGAAIGVSHLVQSTRAGAGYGFELLWILVLVNILKYPFFDFAPRFASATGKSLIEGYQSIGKWAVGAFALLTIATMFTIQAAVTIVTAGLVDSVFHLGMGVVPLSAIILVTTVVVLIIGKYSTLDFIIKIVIIVLAISTMTAVIYAFSSGYHPNEEFSFDFNWSNGTDIFFLIAFIGWMPAPIDVSVWSSLWTVEKAKSLSFRPSLKESMLDFRIGYIGTALLAACFLVLGALVMYGSGKSFSGNGTQFAGQLIDLYGKSIGDWSRPIVAIAAITTMFSTTLTCLDAYPRVMKPTTTILLPFFAKYTSERNFLYWAWIVLVMAGALILLRYFATSMSSMVDVATTLSFITAPILAYLNYKVITSKLMPAYAQPNKFLKIWAITGIIFLTAFTIFYIVWISGLIDIIA